jgi:mannose-6-phosphate isomerase-like protein (cupin superfamily)
MVAPVKTIQGVATDYRTPFEHWVEDELKLEIVRGYGVGPLGKLPLRRWKQRNVDAVFVDIIGCESLAGMYIAEVPPGQSTTRVRQLYEETFYVHKGNGSTTIETPQGTISFEWGERSLFSIPLNCPYQLHNGSGTMPARVISCNTLPIIFSLYRSEAFIFGTDFDFARIDPTVDPTDATLYKPDAKHNRTAVDLYDTLFVPDIFALTRSEFKERGIGTSAVYIEMAKSAISNHVCEVPGRRFFNPHRHGPSAYVFNLTGSGYSLMWPHEGEMVRFDWPEDDIGVIVPPNMWWHGHFATSPNALQLAVKLRSRFNPINHLFDKTHKLVSEGGTVLRFQDLDEKLRGHIWDTFVEECAKKGFTVTAPEKATAA